jgi:hypothetical protein
LSICAAACLAAFGFAIQTSDAQVISDGTGSFSVGIDAGTGALYNSGSGIGFRRNSDGFDPLSPGTPRDSWGLSYGATSSQGDPFNFGNANQTVSSSGFGANSGFVVNDIGGGLISLRQDYSFVAANVLKVHHTITNTSGSAQNILLQRDVDWDVAPTAFGETSTVPGGAPAYVTEASFYGFENPDPLAPYGSNALPAGGVFGPSDLGGGIKVDLLALSDGASITFDYFYGITAEGQTDAGLVAQMAALGIAYIVDTGSSDGGSNGAAIGVALSAVPEPASLSIIGASLIGFGLLRRRQRA